MNDGLDNLGLDCWGGEDVQTSCGAPAIQKAPGGFFSKVKWPEHVVDHSFLCSPKVRGEAIVSTPIRLCGTTFICIIKVFYSPADAEVIVSKTILKFTLK